MIRYTEVSLADLRAKYGGYEPRWIAAARAAIERGDLIESTEWHHVSDLCFYLDLGYDAGLDEGARRTVRAAIIKENMERWRTKERPKRSNYPHPPGQAGGLIMCLDHEPAFTTPPLVALAAAEMLGCEVRRVLGGADHDLEVKAGVPAALMRCMVEHGVAECESIAACRRRHRLEVKLAGAMPDCAHLIRELGGKA